MGNTFVQTPTANSDRCQQPAAKQLAKTILQPQNTSIATAQPSVTAAAIRYANFVYCDTESDSLKLIDLIQKVYPILETKKYVSKMYAVKTEHYLIYVAYDVIEQSEWITLKKDIGSTKIVSIFYGGQYVNREFNPVYRNLIVHNLIYSSMWRISQTRISIDDKIDTWFQLRKYLKTFTRQPQQEPETECTDEFPIVCEREAREQ